jgi:hypothetical protein
LSSKPDPDPNPELNPKPDPDPKIIISGPQHCHKRLEAVAGADNPYSLIAIFGRGHLAIKADSAVYVTRCVPVEVIQRSHRNCTEEIPALHNGIEIFLDPISYVITSEDHQ